MFVCSCYAVTEEDLRQAVRAASHKGCAVDCPAGSGCGSCRQVIEALLREEQQNSRRSQGSASRQAKGIEV